VARKATSGLIAARASTGRKNSEVLMAYIREPSAGEVLSRAVYVPLLLEYLRRVVVMHM